MSVRDKKRRGNNQNAELANLEAIAQYQEPKIQVVKTSTIPETTTNPETQPNQTNNDQEIDMNKQTQTTPAANPTVTLNPVSEAIAQIVTEAQQVTTPQGQAGDITIDVSQPVKETFLTEQVLAEAQKNNEPSETPAPDAREVVKTWVETIDVPKPDVQVIQNLNIHTLTGKQLVEAFGLPATIPGHVVDAILGAASETEHLGQYLPIAGVLISAARTEDKVELEKLADSLIAFAKPFVNAKLLPLWDKAIAGVESFIKPPVEAKPETIAERCKRIQAEADAKRNQNSTVTTTTTDVKLEVIQTTAVIETGESVAAMAMEHPEVVLKRDHADLVGKPEYFDMRASLYAKYHAWEQAEQNKRLAG